MLPEQFISRLAGQKYIDGEDLTKALQEPAPVSIRINRSKWDQRPVPSERVPWNNSGYYLPERPSFTADPLFHGGCYYPQEASGMFLSQVLEQLAGERTGLLALDLCGAPGGKTLILSDFLGGDGVLVSNEVIKTRASILAENVSKWGRGNTLVTQSDPSAFSTLGGFFDIILVDAPCSGEGMFRTETAIAEWSPENGQLCCERQKRILSDIWPSLKEGGLLIYSTCTFNPAENEMNINWLSGVKEAESVRLDISRFNGITEIEYNGIMGYGFYPGRIKGEGLFISVVRKHEPEKTIRQPNQKTSAIKASKADISVLADWAVLNEENVLRKDGKLISLPCDLKFYSILREKIRVIYAGTTLALNRGKDYIPAPELALSVSLRRDAFREIPLDHSGAIAFLRRDPFTVSIDEPGWFLVTGNGIPLGFIKNLGKRFNNYFPVEWRIRMEARSLGAAKLISWTGSADNV